MRILVVDDEPDVVESITIGFELQWRAGFVAGQGEQALHQLPHTPRFLEDRRHAFPGGFGISEAPVL